MYSKLKEYKKIIQNAGYLGAIEVIRLILPFVALPYILSVIGGENYGIAVFSQTVISYFMIFVNFGLDESAVKNVSVNRDNKSRLNEIVTSVLAIKATLLLLGFMVLCVLLSTIPFMLEHKWLFIFAYATLLSDIMYPVWFYQGIEKMKYLTIVKTTSLLFYTISVFIFVRERDDYDIVVLLQSLGNVFAGLLSLYLLFGVNKVRLLKPNLSLIKRTFVDSIPFFMSRVSMMINSNMAKMVSGIFLTMESVAVLDIAGKVCAAGLLPLQSIIQSAYPHIAKTLSQSFVKRSLKYLSIISLAIAVGIVVLSPIVVPLLSSGELEGAVFITQLLSIQVFFCSISIFLGAPVLVSFGHPGAFNKSVIFSTFVLIGLYSIFYLFDIMSIYSFVIITILIEIFVVSYRYLSCKAYKII